MRSLSPVYLDRLTFNADQASTLTSIAENRGRQDLFTRQTPQVLETLRQAAIVESSESSNRLEGITAPKPRVRALVLQSTKPKNRSEQEIAGYRDALNIIHESHEHMPFSTNVILQLHSLVYRYVPTPGGKWKSADNEIVERDPDGTVRRVRFKPVPAFQTPEAMEQLVSLYADATGALAIEPLVVVPLAILDFLCVHPFLDGNGRVGRLLTLLLLYQHGYQVGRYISLERIFEESKESYYETLEKSSQGWHEGEHDPYPWMTYFWGVLLRATREFEDRVGTIRVGRGTKTDQIKQAVNRRTAPFAISDITADCPGISHDMVRRVLRELRDSGAIELQGKGRGAKWLRVRDEKGR
jgi:Fic family protein